MTEQQHATIQYWRESANRDLRAARDLIKTKHFHWALFIYHLSIEKLLKALVIQAGITPPYIHDLERLAVIAGLSLSKTHRVWLKEITKFNIAARYKPDKLDFYKKATATYTGVWSKRCEEIAVWLQQHIQQLG